MSPEKLEQTSTKIVVMATSIDLGAIISIRYAHTQCWSRKVQADAKKFLRDEEGCLLIEVLELLFLRNNQHQNE